MRGRSLIGEKVYWGVVTGLAHGIIFVRRRMDRTPVVLTILRRDGSVEVEGVRYSDVDALSGKLREIHARTPQPYLRSRNQRGANSESVHEALDLLVRASPLIKVGFITAPEPRTAKE